MYLHTEFISATHVPASTSGFEMLLEGNKELAMARGRALRAQAFRNLAIKLGRAVKALVALPGRMLARKATADALYGLDPHILRDIGVDPYDIDGAVERIKGPARPGTGLTALFGRFVAGFRRNATIAALHRLDSRTLADIGLERGDIALLAEQAHGMAPVHTAQSEPRMLVAANDDPHGERKVA